MLSKFWQSFIKAYFRTSKKLLLLPLAVLGITGLFFNSYVSFLSTSNSNMCLPKYNIVFLKTHKCASSSIQNILMRYGDKHKLNFVLPKAGNYIGHPIPFSHALLPEYRRRFTYNILAHHTRFDHKEIQSLMPRDSVYLTIVRDPAMLFESSYNYYGLKRIFSADIHTFISYLPVIEEKILRRRYKGKFGINQMYFDLGGDSADNDTQIRKYIDLLDSWFDLVLVAERMDESLVLMRRFLCWDLDDIVSFRLNARSSQFKTNLTEVERDSIRTANRADSILYLHFYDKFDREVEAFGREKMQAEVDQLKLRTDEWYNLCVQGEQLHNKKSITKHYQHPRVMVLQTRNNVTNGTCAAMTKEELPYTDMLRTRQFIRYIYVSNSKYKSTIRFKNKNHSNFTNRDKLTALRREYARPWVYSNQYVTNSLTNAKQ